MKVKRLRFPLKWSSIRRSKLANPNALLRKNTTHICSGHIDWPKTVMKTAGYSILNLPYGAQWCTIITRPPLCGNTVLHCLYSQWVRCTLGCLCFPTGRAETLCLYNISSIMCRVTCEKVVETNSSNFSFN